MLSEESIDKLKDLIDSQAGADRAELLEALDDVGRTIGTQALVIRNMRMKLDNAQVNEAAINQIVEQSTVQSLLSNLNPPKRNPFTMAEVRTASEQLVVRINSATSFADILKGVVQVARVFI